MKSINKALDVLDMLSNSGEMRLTEICQVTGLTKSTANLILSTLVKRGYASQKMKRGKYSLNSAYININTEYNIYKRIRNLSMPSLVKLSNGLKENVILGIRDGNVAYILAAAETKNVLTTIVEVGSTIPLYCTGNGKIFLAFFNETELEQYFENVELTRITANTITDEKHLRASLKMIKEEGVAHDEEERIIGVKNVAVGIPDAKGKIIASVGITGPSARLTRERIFEILPDLKRCASEISEALAQVQIG